jgi:hypothetical protein
MLWTHASVGVPRFQGSTIIDLPVPCTFDFNVAATKYFYALEEDEVPLSLLFSGSIFYAGENIPMQVTQISWEKEARYRLPIDVWRKMMEHYYPNSAWLCLRKDTFQRLYDYKVSAGFTSWEQTLDSLLIPNEKNMNSELIDKIAKTILYEGYLLYPYRASAVKNRHRWTFGALYPPVYVAQNPHDSSSMRTECLVNAAQTLH